MATSTSKAFDMGKLAMGGIGQVLDSVELVKRAWSTLSMPSPLVPTLDIDELDKRIADLKAVEQWLNVNLSMLHGTIQGLEIQRGTLAAVKAFGASLGSMTPPAASRPAPAQPTRPTRTPPAPEPAAEAASAPAAEPAAAQAKPEAGAAAALPGINPSAWWNLLQQNFNQVAQAALTGAGLQEAAATAMKAAGDLAGSTMPARPAATSAGKAAKADTARAGTRRKAATAPRKRAPAAKAKKAAP